MGWEELAIAVVMFIVTQLLMPKAKVNNAIASGINQINVPQANAASPIPMIWGRVRQDGPNTLWYGDFLAKPNTKQIKTSMFSTKDQIIGYAYYLGLDLGLCLGSDVKLYRIWAGKNLVWPLNPTVGVTTTVTNNPDGSTTTTSVDVELNDANGNTTSSQGSNYGNYSVTTTITITDASGSTTVSTSGSDPNLWTTPLAPTGPGPATGTIYLPKLYGGLDSGGGLQGAFSFYSGSIPQTPDTYMAAKIPDATMPGYNGLAHILFYDFYWGTSANLPQLNFDLARYTNDLGLGAIARIGDWDQNPMEVLYSFMTSSNGGMQLPPSVIDAESFQVAAQILHDEGLGMSMKIDTSQTARDVVKQIMRQVDGSLYQDPYTGKMKVKLYRKDYVVADLVVLDDAIVLEMQSYSIQNWSETFNQIRVKFKYRANDFADAVAADQDLANLNRQGRIITQELTFAGIYEPSVALTIAKRELAKVQVPLYRASLVCNRRASNMRPGDVFKLNWPDGNFTGQVFRVQKVDLGTLADGKVTIEVIQDVYALGVSTFSPPGFQPAAPDGYTPSAQIAVRAIVEAPRMLDQLMRGSTPDDGSSTVLYLAAPPNSASIYYNGYESNDNFVSSSEDVTGVLYPSQGTLAADYNVRNAAYHDTGSLTVNNCAVSSHWVQNAPDSALRLGVNLFMIGNEFFNFFSYVANVDGSVTLTGIRRAMLDTGPTAHLAGSRVWFIGDTNALFGGRVPGTAALKFKVTDSNRFSEYEVAQQPADSVSMSQRPARPLRPAYLTVNGSPVNDGAILTGVSSVTLAWRERNNDANGQLYFEEDGSDGQAGVSYQLEWSSDNGVNWNLGSVSGTSSTLSVSSGTTLVRISALRGGLQSWGYLYHSINVDYIVVGYGSSYGTSYGA